MESDSEMESYPGEKKDIVWSKVFELPDIKEYHLDDDIKNMIILASKNEGIDIMKELKEIKEEDEDTEEELISD